MEKEYEFEITYSNGTTTMRQRVFSEGASILQAKNKFKSMFPNYKIIACVRKGETQRSIQKRAREEKLKNNKDNYGVIGNTLAGIGIAAIGAIGAVFLNKKNKEN